MGRARALRLLILAQTPPTVRESRVQERLRESWGRLLVQAGEFSGLLRTDDWVEAFSWLLMQGLRRGGLSEVQIWGHGRRGEAWAGRDILSSQTVEASTAVGALLRQLAPVFLAPASIWLRTCESFRGPEGKDFARSLVRAAGCLVVGHTESIHFWQGGIFCLGPGQERDTSPQEATLNAGGPTLSGTRIFALRTRLPKEVLGSL